MKVNKSAEYAGKCSHKLCHLSTKGSGGWGPPLMSPLSEWLCERHLAEAWKRWARSAARKATVRRLAAMKKRMASVTMSKTGDTPEKG